MNPENIGQHISLRHSSLWRNPLQYERTNPRAKKCHHQLNETATTGQNWRTRNNSIQLRSSVYRTKTSLTYKNHSKKLEGLLADKGKQSNIQRSMVKSLHIDADIIDRSAILLQGMVQLRKMNLLTGKQLNKVKFPGVIRGEHIYNDYHERVANPGYSRNYLGKYYTK